MSTLSTCSIGQHETCGSTAGICSVPMTRTEGRRPWLTWARIEAWMTVARQRRELARLDDRALHDIGISRATALGEAERPFWDLPGQMRDHV